MKNDLIKLLKVALWFAVAGLFADQAAAMTGSDSSANYVSWTSGSTGGNGFGPWTFYTHSTSTGAGSSSYAGLEVDRDGTGDANIQAGDGSLWKHYAVSYNATTASEQAIAYRAFDTPLSAAGDGFSLSLELQNANNGVGSPGQVGFALRNGNTTGAGNQGAGARLQVYLAGVTNFAAGGTNYLVVQDASGPQATSITNVGTSAAFDFTVTLTGPNTYSLSITRYTGLGITNPPVVVTGTLAGTGTIDSFAMFSWTTDPSSAVNSDVYFNRLSFTNQAAFTCPTIGLGSVVSPLSGTAYSQVITGSGGLAPYSFAVSSGSLPPGLSLSASGTLSGTPTSTGTYTFTVTATDADSCTGTRTYNFTVYGSGADNSANYGGNWYQGSDEGIGFGPWNVYYNYHGEGFAGFSTADVGVNITAADGSVWKLYAINFSADLHQEESTAYRSFNIPLSVAGDACTLSFEANGGIGNPGQVGFSLRNGNVIGSNSTTQNGSNNRAARARLQVYFAGGTSELTVVDASGTNQISGVNLTTYGDDAMVTLTSPNTYSLSITPYTGVGTINSPVVVTGTLAGSGPIDSFSMFSWKNSTDDGYNGDSYFNNVAYTSTTPLRTNNVTFQVDMTVQKATGHFNPPSDTVEVQGSFNNWTAGQYLLTNNPTAVNSNVYSGVVPVVGAVNSGESYKFVINSSSLGMEVYESSTPKQSTLDDGPDDYNRFFQLSNTTTTVLSPVLFSDMELDDYLPKAMSVTFAVNMSGAVGTDGHVFNASAGDTVWINGDFVPWYPWYTQVNPIAAPAQYQMTASGGGIFTTTVALPKGTPVAFEYKYGIGTNGDLGPEDIEAPDGQNHYRVVRSTVTGSYAMPQDTFGYQYHEPFFTYSAKADGRLKNGALSGGTVPVTWLGRPGAHLQSASNVTGPWTDHFETDGTNWSAGFNSTNGLVSQINWPTAGTTFFRLVKP